MAVRSGSFYFTLFHLLILYNAWRTMYIVQNFTCILGGSEFPTKSRSNLTANLLPLHWWEDQGNESLVPSNYEPVRSYDGSKKEHVDSFMDHSLFMTGVGRKTLDSFNKILFGPPFILRVMCLPPL